MSTLTHALCIGGAVAIFAAALPHSAPANEVQLSLDQARLLAREAYRRGEVEAANTVGRALLEADPKDPTGLLVMAATEPLLGRPAEGRKAGRLAFGAAETPRDKWEAAYLTSRAAVAEEKYTTAQFWLRRAYHRAETETQRDQIADAFRQVRRVSPWHLSFAFDVAPNSNVNGGSSSEFLVIEGDDGLVGSLSPSAQALSGVTASITAEIGYDILRRANHQTTLTFRGYRTFNELSDESQDDIDDYAERQEAIGFRVPEVTGSDFDYGLAQVQVAHRRAGVPWFLPDRYVVSYGQTWYGDDKLDRVMQGTLSKRIPLGDVTSLRLAGEAERRLPDRDTAEDRNAFELRANFARQLASGDVARLSFSATDVQSDDSNVDYAGWSVTAGYVLGETVGGVRISGHLEYSERDYDQYILLQYTGGREDQEWNGALNFTVESMNYMGFTPVISVNGRQSTSNISRFEGDSLGLSVGFRSAF